MVDYIDATGRGRRRSVGVAAFFLVLAVFLFFLPQPYQSPIRQTLRATALYPFIWTQSELVVRATASVDVGALRAERDSLSAVVSAQASLAEENRRLRQLLGLRSRVGALFVPAELIRVGTEGAESTFLVDVGRVDGVVAGSPVIAPEGLLGVVWEVGEETAHGIDWTNPDFRASAMTVDGEAYGIVESRRGRYREEDRLALVGAPFHVEVETGTGVVTSGRGGIYPRGIQVGTVLEIEEADAGWRKSYLLRPAIRPESVTHVLVGIPGEASEDLSPVWSEPVPDSAGSP